MSHYIRGRHLIAFIPLTLISGVTFASYQSPDGDFQLSGFGTLGLASSSAEGALFNTPGQGGGAGKKPSLNPDSKLAVQGTYIASPHFSATAQVLAKYDAEGQYAPTMEWAFAKWQASPSLTVRAGRMGAPYFMVSDYRDVGYVSMAVRPPLDVYGQVPVTHFEGADVAYQFNVNDWTLTPSFWSGTSKSKYASSLITSPVDVTIKGQVGWNILADAGNGLSLRVGRMVGKLSLRSELGSALAAGAGQANAGLSQYSSAASAAAAQFATLAAASSGATQAQYLALADQSTRAAALASDAAGTMSDVNALVSPTDAFASFTGIGLAYDGAVWTGSLEYTKRKTRSFISDTTGWYGLLGYRINKFTPFVGLSKLTVNRAATNPVAVTSLSALAPAIVDASAASAASQLDAASAQIRGGVSGVLGVENHDERTASIGLRWDASNNVAVKAQFDRISKPVDSNGMFLIADPTQVDSQTFSAGKRTINVMSLAIDFVF